MAFGMSLCGENCVTNCLDAGTRMVVVINPRKRTVTVYQSPARIVLLREADTLDGSDVVPDWLLPITTIFAYSFRHNG